MKHFIVYQTRDTAVSSKYVQNNVFELFAENADEALKRIKAKEDPIEYDFVYYYDVHELSDVPFSGERRVNFTNLD